MTGGGDVEVMIRLDELTKVYPGQGRPAVDGVTLEVPEGEIAVLVGPSGCGKTTTLKMINRLVEPTSGRIFIGGDEVTRVNPDRLRRQIGYVIQQIGLFPHQTISDNIATVPRLLDWDRDRIAARIDELLDLVGLDPPLFRDRYPKQLSGGQRQRVGVARALAADPPVMLMDEPFGAIDPITRARLQNEFLRLQEQLRKTIVFVTHDIDEAIKMGDRIAIFSEQARVIQYDTPENILTAPADEFIEEFVGAGAALKRLNLSRVRDIELGDWPTASTFDEAPTIRATLEGSHRDHVLLLDEQQRPLRWVSRRDLDGRDLRRAGLPVSAIVEPAATLHDTLDEMLTSSVGCAVVVDGRGRYSGVVDVNAIVAAMEAMRSEARERFGGAGVAIAGEADRDG
jgi:osmoprotectant transport system ATP-binding protein